MTKELNFDPQTGNAGLPRKPWVGVYLGYSPAIYEAYNFRRPKWQKYGAEVVDVTLNGPAHAGGLKTGDRIVQVDEKMVDTVDDVIRCWQGKEVGDSVVVVAIRENEELILSLVMGEALEPTD